MKLDLKAPIKTNISGTRTEPIGNFIRNALFASQGISNARELYEKCSGDTAELSVSELSDIQKVINNSFSAGICWQVDDIFNQKEKK